MTPEREKLNDLEKVTGIKADFILTVAREVAWLRETTCRRTPPALPDIRREETDQEAIHYADVVAATLVALRNGGYDKPPLIAADIVLPKEDFSSGTVDWVSREESEAVAEHAPRSASEFI